MKLRLRAAVAVAACVGLALAAAGCSSPRKAAYSSTPQLALIVPDYTSEYWDSLHDAAVSEAQDLSIAVISDSASTLTDAKAQAARVAALARAKYSCFAVAPIDPVQLISPLVAVAKQKVPILNFGVRLDSDAAKGAGVPIASFIGPLDDEIGQIAGRKMAALLPSGSDVAMILGTTIDSDAAAQRNGFQLAATEGPAHRLNVVTSDATNDDYAKATQVVADLLDARPNLRGIFTSSDIIGLAAAKAVKEAGMSDKVSIVSVDGTKAGLQAVRNGQFAATVASFPQLTGQLVVRACQLLVTQQAVQPRILVPSRLVDSSNVAAALGSYPGPWEKVPDPLGQ